MAHTLAAQSVFLVSPIKPFFWILLVLGWAYLAAIIDKDASKHYFNKTLWNGALLGTGLTAMLVMLFVPVFIVGFLLALVIVAGGFFAYHSFRNTQVPPKDKWDLTFNRVRDAIDERAYAAAQENASIKLLNKDTSPIDVPVGDDPAVPAFEAFENAMNFLLQRGGEKLELHITSEKTLFQAFVDGMAFDLPALDTPTGMALVDYLKAKTGMDPADRRKKQSAMLLIDAGELGRHNLALMTIGSTRELRLRIAMDPGKQTVRPIEQLGLLPQQVQQLEPIFGDHTQVVVVACPPGHGQTTTLYSFLKKHDPYMLSIFTLEEEVAFEMEGVSHELIASAADGATVAKTLASVIRRDPQVVMLDSLTDAQVARTAASSVDHTRLYVGMNAPDTFAALKTWAKSVGDLSIAGSSLRAIVSPRLLRRLCPTCRVPYSVDEAALKKLNLPPSRVKQLFQHSGQVMVRNKPEQCPTCSGIGYKGRFGVFEIMVLDDQARAFLAQGKLDPLRSHLRKNKMLWLQEAALARVVEGATSIAEIKRVLGGK